MSNNYSLETIEQQQQIEELNSQSYLILSYNGSSYKFTLQQLRDWIGVQEENQKMGSGSFIGNICMMLNRNVPVGHVLCNGNGTTLEQVNTDSPAWINSASVLYPELYTAISNGDIEYFTWEQAKAQYLTKITNQRNFGGWLKPVWDIDNDKFLPPLIPNNFYISKASDSVNFKGAKLPNIKGKFAVPDYFDYVWKNKLDGSFYKLGENTGGASATNSNDVEGIGFDASLSNPYYSNDATVPTVDAVNFIFVMCISTMTSEESSNSSLYATKIELNNEVTRAKREEKKIDVRVDNLISLISRQQQGQVFENEEEMITWLNVPSNLLNLKIGWNFLFRDHTIDYSYQWMGSWDGTTDSLKRIAGGVNLNGYYTTNQTDDLLNDKVDKEEGKGLSTNDFTNVYKAKVEDMVTQVDLNALKTILMEALEGKFDTEKLNSYLTDDNKDKEDEALSVAGINVFVKRELSEKVDKENTFTKTSNIKDLISNEDISGKYLDLSSFSNVETVEDFDITFNSHLNPSLETVEPHIVYIKSTNSLIYREIVDGSYNDTFLIKRGAIVNPNLEGKYYYKLPNEDMIVSIAPSRPVWYVSSVTLETEDYTYETIEAFEEAFKELADRTTYNGKVIKIQKSGNFEYSLSVSLGSTEGDFEYANETEFAQDFENYTNKLAFDNKIIKFLESGEYDLELLNTSSETFDLEYADEQELRDDFENTAQDRRVEAFNSKIIHLQDSDSMFLGRVNEIPLFKQCTVTELPQNYLLETYVAEKPSTDIGSYNEITLSEIVTRLNQLEAGGSDGGIVDFKEKTDNVYEISSLSIVNGGTGYSVGDRIRCIFNNISAGDRRGEILVNGVGENGVVTSCIISNQGFYLENISQSNVQTINRDKDLEQASGLVLDIIANSRTSTNLSNIEKQKNCRVEVRCDETHNNSGALYSYYVPDGASVEAGEWVYQKEVQNDTRDFSIDKINLNSEVTGVLPIKNGGVGIDASNTINVLNAEQLLGINENGIFSNINVIDGGEF